MHFLLRVLLYFNLCSIHCLPLMVVVFMAVSALRRLGSFQSIYYVLLSSYFPNRIYIKTSKYILPPVVEFSFNCLRGLSQGPERPSGDPGPLCGGHGKAAGVSCLSCRGASLLQASPFVVKGLRVFRGNLKL